MNPTSPNPPNQLQPTTEAGTSAGTAVRQELLPAAARAEFITCLRRRFKNDELVPFTEAADFAALAHKGQQRKNGDPYITHPLKVAEIVSDWRLDREAIIAALLHDVVEDTEYTLTDIDDRFGPEIAGLVNGLSKIEQIEQLEHHNEDLVASKEALAVLKASASFRKLLLAISRDWRVILVKIADRLHNMRTLENINSRAKRRRISQETIDIYVPIAQRLGFMDICGELQTLSFQHIHPVRFAVLSAAMERANSNMRKSIPKIKRAITNAMKKTSVKITIMTREKNIYSTYRKMIEKKLSFSEIDDIVGFRLVMDKRLDCYVTLGVVHELFRPVPDKLKDYISQPKVNGYQSIHTTVLTKSGNIVELQLRDWEMHRYAEYGLAAHSDYKDIAHLAEQDRKKAPRKIQDHTNRLLSNLMTLSSGGLDAGEFLRNMRLDLFPNEVVVLTPKGAVIELIKGATALDMAYHVHTELGDKAKSATINGETLPISTALNSGDIVEIITAEDTTPNPQWLNFVATSKARSHLRSRLKENYSEEMALLGRNLLDRALHTNGLTINDLEEGTVTKFLNSNYPSHTIEELYTEIALSKMSAEIIANELIGPHRHLQARQKELSISIAGDRHAGITRAKCCEPLPPEPIIGIMRKNFGLDVHRKDCREIADQVTSKKYIHLHWDTANSDSTYKVSLTLSCNNRQGLLADVFAKFPTEGVNIVSINLGAAEETNPVAVIALEAEVRDARQIERLFRRLNEIKGVSITRAGAAST